MIHIFHFLPTSMVVEIENPFSWIFNAIFSEKSCLILMPFLTCYLYRPVSRKPRKLFGPVKPFLDHLYVLRVWREPQFIFRICEENSSVMYQSIPRPPIPPPWAPPGHFTHVKLRTVGNLTQTKAHPVGHLTFVSKRLSAVGNKRDFAIFWYSTWAAFTVHCSCWCHVVFFLLLSFYIVISWNMPLFKAWSEDTLNKKFVVAEILPVHV